MWSGITGIVQSAASFLSSSKVPTGTPVIFQEEMRKTNHFTSKKFFMAWTSFVGLLVFYFFSVGVLFLLPAHPEVVTGYITIFTKTIEVVAIIIAAYLGLQAAIDFKYGSSSNVSNESVTSTENIEQKIIQEQTAKYADVYKDDPSYAPLEWVFEQDNN